MYPRHQGRLSQRSGLCLELGRIEKQTQAQKRVHTHTPMCERTHACMFGSGVQGRMPKRSVGGLHGSKAGRGEGRVDSLGGWAGRSIFLCCRPTFQRRHIVMTLACGRVRAAETVRTDRSVVSTPDQSDVRSVARGKLCVRTCSDLSHSIVDRLVFEPVPLEHAISAIVAVNKLVVR